MPTAPQHVLIMSVAILSAAFQLCGRQADADETVSGGSLSFFADEQDARILLDRLNSDPEIAFIVPDGPRLPPPQQQLPPLPPMTGRQRATLMVTLAVCAWDDGYFQRWRAMRPVDGLNDGEHILWHIAAGPLARGREVHPIPDPWGGWTSDKPFCRPDVMPFATIRLNLVTRHAAYTAEERASHRALNSFWIDGDRLVASDFQWSAASLEPGGSRQTARWVAGLADWFSRHAVGLHARGDGEIFWTFPSALRRLKSGTPYYSRNFELDEAIRRAP